MDEVAQDFLRYVRPLWGRLQAVARRYCARREDAADLVQETLLRAWRAYSPIEGPTHPRAWLFAIMRNIVIDWHRGTSRRILMVSADETELTEVVSNALDAPFADFPAMSEGAFREFLDAAVVRAFDSLEAPNREVVVLSVAGDLTYREIAEVLDCPIGTVMSRMGRARRALREQLSEYARSPSRTKEVRP